MRVAISGATGLVGRALGMSFSAEGAHIVAISRSEYAARRMGPGARVRRVVVWDPARGRLDGAKLEGCDAVVHLAGESIAGVWTRAKRARIRDSRVHGTELLARTLAALERPPAVFLSASGVNYYGNRPADTPLDENAAPGTGFLAETAAAWEAATRAAEAAGIRTVRMRLGVVLSRRGGLLRAVLPLFRLGLGGQLGSGEQVMSWIAIPDIPAAVRHIIAEPSLAGPVNLASPKPVSNAEFTDTLGRVLDRPTPLTVPELVLHVLPGRMAQETMLTGARVVPRRLEETGFRFAYPDLEGALRHVLRNAE